MVHDCRVEAVSRIEIREIIGATKSKTGRGLNLAGAIGLDVGYITSESRLILWTEPHEMCRCVWPDVSRHWSSIDIVLWFGL